MSVLERPMPHSEEFEQAVLSSALRSRKAALGCSELLQPADFYNRAHERIWDAALSVQSRGVTVDELSVADELRRRGQLEATGGAAYLRQLTDAVATAADWKWYAQRVRNTGLLRWAVEICEDIRGKALDPDTDPEELLEAMTVILLQRNRPVAGEPVRLLDQLRAEEQRIRRGEVLEVCYTGIPRLDEIAGGLGAKELGIICGRPGAGKTALGLQIAEHGARTYGPGCIVSLEMSVDSLARRVLAGKTDFNFRELRECGRRSDRRTGYDRFGGADLGDITDAINRMADVAGRIWIDEYAYELPKLIARVHRLKLEHGIRWVMVDYGQLVKSGIRGQGKVEEVTYVARALKNEVATLLGVPVFVLVQASREVEKRGGDRGRRDEPQDGKLPRLQKSDLGWSGEWEAVANAIWLLNLDRKPDAGSEVADVTLEVAKNRNGAADEDVRLRFQRARFRFEGRDDYHEEREAPPTRRAEAFADDERRFP